MIFRYNSHINRRESITIALSPCLRYLATGSEDRTARIVDLRGGREIVKLPGHKDVVSGVAFNPLFPQLATCSFDGTVRFYVDPTISPDVPGVWYEEIGLSQSMVDYETKNRNSFKMGSYYCTFIFCIVLLHYILFGVENMM